MFCEILIFVNLFYTANYTMHFVTQASNIDSKCIINLRETV